VVDVDLDDLDLAGMRGGDLVDDRSDHLAGPAPLGPEIDQHRRFGLQHLCLEVVIAHVHNLVSHGQTPDLSNEAAAGNGADWVKLGIEPADNKTATQPRSARSLRPPGDTRKRGRAAR